MDMPYAELFPRMEWAIKDGFHLEASWIAYAIIENRVASLLRVMKKPAPYQLGSKLGLLREARDADTGLEAILRELGLDLGNKTKDIGKQKDLGAAGRWKDDRNKLMHAMAADGSSWQELGPAAKRLAEEGKELARKFNSALLALRNLKGIPNPPP